MTLVVVVLTVLLAQAHLVARAWLGGLAPDPLVVLATLLALVLPRRRLVLAALLLGWVRALTLAEPMGGQVLCLWAAMALVAFLREGLVAGGRSGVLVAGGLLALCWWSSAQVLGLAADAPVSAGRELLLGVPLAVPFAGLALGREP